MSTQQRMTWEEWVGSTNQRLDQIDRRIEALQENNVEWSTWSFKVSRTLDDIHDEMANTSDRLDQICNALKEIKTDQQQQKTMWVAVMKHLGLSLDGETDAKP